jgi:hypothetical protein
MMLVTLFNNSMDTTGRVAPLRSVRIVSLDLLQADLEVVEALVDEADLVEALEVEEALLDGVDLEVVSVEGEAAMAVVPVMEVVLVVSMVAVQHLLPHQTPLPILLRQGPKEARLSMFAM